MAGYLMYRRQRVEEASEPLYDRFYITGRVFDFPVSYSMVAEVCGGSDAKLAVKELEAVERLLRAEYDSAYEVEFARSGW
jgi:hypothetical protein